MGSVSFFGVVTKDDGATTDDKDDVYTFTLSQDQCIIFAAESKNGNSCFPTLNSLDENLATASFGAQNGGGVSHIELIFKCCANLVPCTS